MQNKVMQPRSSKQIFTFLVLAAMFLSAVPFAPAYSRAIDLAGMDRGVDPGDDFFAYTNGGWMKSTEIPADRTSFGTFDVVLNTVSRRTADIITESVNSTDPEAKMVGDYYKAFLDEATIEKRGLEPVQPELTEIAGVKDQAALSRILGSQLRADVDPL